VSSGVEPTATRKAPALAPRGAGSDATALHSSDVGAALSAHAVGKRYRLSRSRVRPLLRQVWYGAAAPAHDAFWAVRDVSFALERGGSLGIVGRNGSGKSTLLRLLSGTARATTGRVHVGARLACLLELGTGFQALETGRQNAEGWLVLLGGMTRAEARRAAGEVAAFAQIGDYFDRPLRTYSSGMQLRVAFATAAMLDPEVLVADEVLAVGDDGFQRRCNAFFDRFLARGGSLVLCSHDLSQVQRLCERTLWLDGGRVRELDETRSVIRHYREAMGGAPEGADDADRDAGALHRPGETTGLACEVVDLHLLDDGGEDVREVEPGASVAVVADLAGHGETPHVHISFTRDDATPVYGVSSDMDDVAPEPLGGGRYRYRLAFPSLALRPATYVLKAHALDETATRLYDTVEIRFRVRGEPSAALVDIAAAWR